MIYCKKQIVNFTRKYCEDNQLETAIQVTISNEFLLTLDRHQKCAPLHLNNLNQTIETKRQSRNNSIPSIVSLVRNSVRFLLLNIIQRKMASSSVYM